jgi:hypothetical protein
LLDSIGDESNSFDLIKSLSQFFSFVLIGFKFGHPVCTSWNLNQWTISCWPKNSMTLIIFAKFAAIYPEEIHLLLFISEKLRALCLKSVYSKHILFEIQFHIGRRESKTPFLFKNKCQLFKI